MNRSCKDTRRDRGTAWHRRFRFQDSFGVASLSGDLGCIGAEAKRSMDDASKAAFIASSVPLDVRGARTQRRRAFGMRATRK